MIAPVRLFQYWNTATPPDEVLALLNTWGSDPGVIQVVYDQVRARAFLADRLGSRIADAFDACANPALQSDLFRLAAVYAEGGLYVDADLGSLGRVSDLIRPAPAGLLVALLDGPNNDLIFARHPRLPLIARLLEQVVNNIEARKSNNVAEVSGPGVLISALDDPAARSLFEGWIVETRLSALRVIKMPLNMNYKTLPDDWRNIFASGTESIFTTTGKTLADAARFPADTRDLAVLPAGSVPVMQYADTMPAGSWGATAMSSWQSDPLFRYRFFDRAAAKEYLQSTCGPGVLKAFVLAEDEQLRSDLLALAWLLNEGGLYVRAGLANRGGWNWLLAAAPGGLLTGQLNPMIVNDVIYAPEPQADLIKRSLEIMLERLSDYTDGPTRTPAVVRPAFQEVVVSLIWPKNKKYSDFASWRVEDRYSLGRFLSRPPEPTA